MPRPSWRIRLFHLFLLIRRPMTLGVRVIVAGQDDTVLLVRHTYVAGWHLPGGGVEKGETAELAARKELLEETGLLPEGPLEPLAILANQRASRRDHVVLFLCRTWRREREFKSDQEIAEIGFFPIGDLPDGTTGPTRSRIKEALVKGGHTGGRRFPEFW